MANELKSTSSSQLADLTQKKTEMVNSLEHDETWSSSSWKYKDTLKYRLLGASVTKAGLESVDQKQVSNIIYKVSKGSKYFTREEEKDEILTHKIDKLIKRKHELERGNLSGEIYRANKLLSELEVNRDLSQRIVHIDCDAFYAAVEELDNPELVNIPFAVGEGVISTCNYKAREYGCRSGMACFVAKKLCPSLHCIGINMNKYVKVAEDIRGVFTLYDENFEAAGLDEAYLNITEYCGEQKRTAWEVVQEIRDLIQKKVGIKVSAGIACNVMLAKIASNYGKPNGQYEIGMDRGKIMEFMTNLPTRKVNGIGQVLERELKAVGIKVCGDIFEHRGILRMLFGDKTFEFLMRVYAGIGRNRLVDISKVEKRSIGSERTFGETSSGEEIRSKLLSCAQQLEKDCVDTRIKGGLTLVVKVKLDTFQVYTRQRQVVKPIYKAEDLFRYSQSILEKLEADLGRLKIRLLGLRLTRLVGEGVREKGGKNLKWYFNRAEDGDGTVAIVSKRLREDEEGMEGDKLVECPVCGSRQKVQNDEKLNEHVDFCLSKGEIIKAVQESLFDGTGSRME